MHALPPALDGRGESAACHQSGCLSTCRQTSPFDRGSTVAGATFCRRHLHILLRFHFELPLMLGACSATTPLSISAACMLRCTSVATSTLALHLRRCCFTVPAFLVALLPDQTALPSHWRPSQIISAAARVPLHKQRRRPGL